MVGAELRLISQEDVEKACGFRIYAGVQSREIDVIYAMALTGKGRESKLKDLGFWNQSVEFGGTLSGASASGLRRRLRKRELSCD